MWENNREGVGVLGRCRGRWVGSWMSRGGGCGKGWNEKGKQEVEREMVKGKYVKVSEENGFKSR